MTLKFAISVLLVFSLLANSQWVSQDSGTNLSLLDVDFVNQTTGYVVGGPYIGFPEFPDGVLLKTTDAGETWTWLTSPGDHQLSSVCFINTTYGWAAGEEHIYKTLNGGETWREQDYEVDLIGSARGFFHDLECIDENTTYAVSFNGVIVKTENGETWFQQEGNWNGSSPGLFSISCVDRDNCWTVGHEGTVLHTSNGGDTWVTQNSQTHLGLNAVHFIDEENGWLSGGVASSSTRRTVNGGETWDNLTIDTLAFARGMYFVNATHGWIVGSNVIRFTNDSGENWYAQNTDIDRYGSVPVILRGVDFPAENVGWAVGDDGVILRFGEPSSSGSACPALTHDCDADFVPEWVYGDDGCVVNYTCVEPRPACPEVSLILPECELPTIPIPTWDEETNCRGEYICQIPGSGSTTSQSGGEQEQGQSEDQEGSSPATFNAVESVVSFFQGVLNWFGTVFVTR